eukprot:6286775-Amphidinium_carterae.1
MPIAPKRVFDAWPPEQSSLRHVPTLDLFLVVLDKGMACESGGVPPDDIMSLAPHLEVLITRIGHLTMRLQQGNLEHDDLLRRDSTEACSLAWTNGVWYATSTLRDMCRQLQLA